MWALTPGRELAQSGRRGALVTLHHEPTRFVRRVLRGRRVPNMGSWGHRSRDPGAGWGAHVGFPGPSDTWGFCLQEGGLFDREGRLLTFLLLFK